MSSLHKKPFSLSSFKTLSYFILPDNTHSILHHVHKSNCHYEVHCRTGTEPKSFKWKASILMTISYWHMVNLH